jgi:large subunit ribosomal protein L29
MKGKQFHEMTNQELTAKEAELRAELFKLRFNHATGQLANPNLLSVYKRDIARVKTVLRDREIKGITGPLAAAPAKKAVKKSAAKA